MADVVPKSRGVRTIDWRLLRDLVDGAAESKAGERRDIPHAVRKYVIARDEACRICRNSYGLHVHHVQPYGPSDAANLVTVCKFCHASIHNLLFVLGKHRYVNALSGFRSGRIP